MYRTPRNAPYHLALGLAVTAACVLIWLSLGVGIIGADGDPANLMYLGVLGVAFAGTVMSRLRPEGMARTLAAMAVAQAAVALIALVAQLGLPWSGPAEILLLNGFFVALFLASAWLFLRSTRWSPTRR